jgi:electron transfer flavoprotein alpha subunit
MMSGQSEIWVFSDREILVPELIGGACGLAAQLNAAVTCLVVGPRQQAEAALRQGAGRVIWLSRQAEEAQVEDYVDTMTALVLENRPFLFLIGASKRGRVVAGRIAARVGAAVLPDILDFQVDGVEINTTHLMYAGGARRRERATTEITIATVGPGVFEPTGGSGNLGSIEEAAMIEPKIKLQIVGRKPKPPVSVNLPAAKRVVCPGRGLAKEEDLAMIHELAQAAQAEVGCSRPLAEGLNWLPRERYIGVSGANLKSDLYLAVGVSGQAQHTVGITGCRVVAAINNDASAPIFKQADYGIVGDLYEIVPALTQALKAR